LRSGRTLNRYGNPVRFKLPSLSDIVSSVATNSSSSHSWTGTETREKMEQNEEQGGGGSHSSHTTQ
jgi:hypothetical protein